MTRRVRPSTKPVTIGLERNSAIQPIPRKPAASRTRPEPRANAAVYDAACAVPATPKLASNDPDSTDTVDTGPTTSWRDEPKIAYATSATGTA